MQACTSVNGVAAHVTVCGAAAVVLKSLVAFSTKFLYTVNGRFLKNHD